MATDRGYIAANNAERARLEALVSKCTDADLARPMPAGWTVASVLTHIAFWDQRIVLLLEQWEKGKPPRHEVEDDVDWINDAAKPIMLALPPRKAAEVAVAVARAVDRKVEGVSEEILSRNERDKLLNFSRAAHRKQHLDEIERALRG